MSTRATLTVKDDRDQFHIYRHHDGYPSGPHRVVHDLGLARRLAWDLPRFEAADFAAAILAVMKEGPGSVYLTKVAENHSDRAFHYEIEPLQDQVSTQIGLTILESTWKPDGTMRELFRGSLEKAGENFCPPEKSPEHSRELKILQTAEQTLLRAQEEIAQLTGGRPDEDTKLVHEQIEAASRDLAKVQRLLEKADPWQALSVLQQSPNAYDGKAALKAHERFQR